MRGQPSLCPPLGSRAPCLARLLDPLRDGRCTARLPLSTCPPAGSIRRPDLSVGSIRWIYPLDLSVGRQLPTGAASCHWHILSQQPAQLALRWSRLSTPRGGPAASPAPPSRPYPCLLRPCSLKWLLPCSEQIWQLDPVRPRASHAKKTWVRQAPGKHISRCSATAQQFCACTYPKQGR